MICESFAAVLAKRIKTRLLSPGWLQASVPSGIPHVWHLRRSRPSQDSEMPAVRALPTETASQDVTISFTGSAGVPRMVGYSHRSHDTANEGT